MVKKTFFFTEHSKRLAKVIFGNQTQRINSNRFLKAKISLFFFFWSYYSSSLDLENTIATTNHYFILFKKKKPNWIKKKKIFLFSPLFFVHLSLMLLYLNSWKVQHTIIRTKTQSKNLNHENVLSYKPNEIRKRERERETHLGRMVVERRTSGCGGGVDWQRGFDWCEGSPWVFHLCSPPILCLCGWMNRFENHTIQWTIKERRDSRFLRSN